MNVVLLSAMALACSDFAVAAAPAPAIAVAANAAVQGNATTEAAPAAVENETTDAAVESVEDADDLPLEDPVVFENESDEAVAEKLISYIENLDTLQGDFTQIAPSGAISSGRFYLRRPGLLRFEYDPPSPLLIVANGGLVYVRDEALETTDSYPVGKTPLKFLLRETIDREDAQIVSVDRGVDNFAVTFSSTDEETEGELTLFASAPDLALRRWIIRDLQGGLTVVTLDNVKTGERIANNLFRAPEAGGRFLDR